MRISLSAAEIAIAGINIIHSIVSWYKYPTGVRSIPTLCNSGARVPCKITLKCELRSSELCSFVDPLCRVIIIKIIILFSAVSYVGSQFGRLSNCDVYRT